MSDDECPKTLTTLEPVKKQTHANDTDEVEICPIEADADDDEFDEEPILLEVYNADDEHKDTDNAIMVDKSSTPNESGRRERKQHFPSLTNNRRTKLQTPKINSKNGGDDTIVTPNKPIPSPSPGTIEIPRELITSDVSVISPIIINHIKVPSGNSDDLIAILQGDDNGTAKHATTSVEHYELSMTKTNGDQQPQPPAKLTAEEEREIAIEQIMSLPKKKKGRPKMNQALKAARKRKRHFPSLTNNRRTKLQTPKINSKNGGDDTIVTPNKPIPSPSPGTIEIPRELITSDVSVISPIIINHIKVPSGNSDDLIAILQGDDNGTAKHATTSVEHYELSMTKTNGDQQPQPPAKLTAEEEREIAIEQIMSLPKKKKGRPKMNQALKAARDSKVVKKTKHVALVNSLVSEWNDNDAKHDDTTETEIVVEIRPQKKATVAEPVQPTFRRSRIIKKKIIWDPDAPETAINYASLAHTTGAGPVKRPRKSINTKIKTEQTDDEMDGDSSVGGEVTMPLAPAPKKKKTSEIDKLLGDEGAANMLNSLHHQANNNNNKIDGTSPGKIPRAKSIKTEPINVQATPPASAAKAKAIKSKEIKEPSPQKPQTNSNKKTATPKAAATPKKRGPKTSESWDFVYNARPLQDDCMIIRRRSNSSYSSNASLNRTSIDLPNAPPLNDLDAIDTDHVFDTQVKRPRSNKEKTFEFAKPKAKKIGKFDSDTKYSSTFDEAKNSTKLDDIDFGALPIKLENGHDKDDDFTQISIVRFENFVQIVLQPNESLLTVQMLKEIETVLHSLESEKGCKLVLLTSASDNFCTGLDYTSLVQSTGEKRRASAMELAKKVNNFVQTLAAFKKPLVAFVKGIVNGLGARVLPLFDVVWAESGAVFSANSHGCGEIIEGTASLYTTDKIDYNAKAKLLFLQEVMDAEEAKECNVVSQVLKHGSNADHRILIECDKLATKSASILETCRLIQQQTLLPELKESLKIEQKQLLQQWTKSDFVEKLKAQL